MSRDWTPKESYFVEEYFKENKGISLFETVKKISWVLDGRNVPLYTEEELERREKYPYIGNLMNCFNQMYEGLQKISGGLDLLMEKELELQRYISGGCKKTSETKASVVIEWFEGRLDPCFRYSQRNDELFLGSLLKEAQELAEKKYPLEEELERRDGEQFAGYEVPERLKHMARLIMFRFGINGMCDGMFICNRIARCGGIGDGNGNFSGNTVNDPGRVAEALREAYGCNIYVSDIDELKEIIRTCKLDIESAKIGLHARLKNLCEELKDEKTDSWRKDYLKGCVERTENSLELLELPEAIAYVRKG